MYLALTEMIQASKWPSGRCTVRPQSRQYILSANTYNTLSARAKRFVAGAFAPVANSGVYANVQVA